MKNWEFKIIILGQPLANFKWKDPERYPIIPIKSPKGFGNMTLMEIDI